MHSQPLSLVIRLWHLIRHMTPCETAGIRVFVIYPDFHIVLPAIFNSISEKIKPLVRQILSDEAGSRVHNYPTTTCLTEHFHVIIDQIFGDIAVPYKEREGPIFP